MNDTDLIQQCRAGRAAAFGALVERYQPEAIGHALAILGHREDALDAVQEAFLAAFRAIERFQPGRSFYPWFYTILRNRCYNLLEERRAAPAELNDPVLLVAQPDTDGVDPARLLEEALRQLAPEDRELITLKHLDGLRYHQLAERLEIPPGTVMSRLYHARRRLRERIVELRGREEANHA